MATSSTIKRNNNNDNVDTIMVDPPLIPIFLVTEDGRTFKLDWSFISLSLLVSSYYDATSKDTLSVYIKKELCYLESRLERISNETKMLPAKDIQSAERLQQELETVATQYKEQQQLEKLANIDRQEIATRNRIELYVPSITHNTALFLQEFGKLLYKCMPITKLNSYLSATPDDSMIDEIELDTDIVQAINNAMPKNYGALKKRVDLISNAIIAADQLTMSLVCVVLNKYLSLVIQRELINGTTLGTELGITNDFSLDELLELEIQNSFISPSIPSKKT